MEIDESMVMFVCVRGRGRSVSMHILLCAYSTKTINYSNSFPQEVTRVAEQVVTRRADDRSYGVSE